MLALQVTTLSLRGELGLSNIQAGFAAQSFAIACDSELPDSGPENQVTTVFARSPFTIFVNLRPNDFTHASLRGVSREDPRAFYSSLRDFLNR